MSEWMLYGLMIVGMMIAVVAMEIVGRWMARLDIRRSYREVSSMDLSKRVRE